MVPVPDLDGTAAGVFLVNGRLLRYRPQER
jgi:hypothetical protein